MKELKATIQFNSLDEANLFARQYGRQTLRGHAVSPDAKVSIYGITEDDKIWIDDYISKINKEVSHAV